jgi:porin
VPGFKEQLLARGLKVDFFATQFYHGVTSGGRDREWEYGGKLDLLTTLDGDRAGLWQGFFVDAHVESRLGQSVNDHDGLLAPSNIAMSFPKSDENVTALTGLKFTQALSEQFAVFAGKINTLDEFPIRYNEQLGLGRPGIGGFMNTSLVFNPIAARTVPYAAAGAGFAFLQDLQPLFVFSILDPRERATIGLQDLYAEGVVLVPDLTLRREFLGRPGTYNFGGTYSTANYTSFERSAYLNLPQPGVPLPTESDSWSLYANFYQALWVSACNPTRSWGVFGATGLSDGNPNPIRHSASLGVGGQVMRENRPLDTFGIGLFHLGLSSEARRLLAPVLPQRDEYGIECFYNRALTRNIRTTGDLQVARPSTVAFDTAVITGVRLEMFY